MLSILAVLCGGPLLGIYSSDPEVIQYGMLRLTTVSLLQPLGALMGVTASVLRGMGYSTIPMIVTMSSVCGFRVIWIFHGVPGLPHPAGAVSVLPHHLGPGGAVQLYFLFCGEKAHGEKIGPCAGEMTVL